MSKKGSAFMNSASVDLKHRLARLQTVVLVVAVTAATSCRQPAMEQRVVARVGDARLTVDELLQEIPPHLRPHVTREDMQEYLMRWINAQILYQEAKRRKIDAQMDVRRELRNLEVDLVGNALLDVEIEQPVDLPEEDIQRYYDSNRNSFIRSAAELHVLHAQSADSTSAEALYQRLVAGEDFSGTARRLAVEFEDSTSWDLYLSEDETAPEIADHVFRLPIGKISTPIRSDMGYHIFKILNRYPKDTIRELGQVRPQIVTKLEVEKRQARYRQLLSDLRSKTTVETNLAALDQVPLDSMSAQDRAVVGEKR